MWDLLQKKNTLKHGPVSRNPPALNVTQSAGAAAWVAQFVETVETCKTDWWKSNDWCDWKPPAASMGLACTLWRAYILRIASHYSLVESANLDSCTCCGCPLSMPGPLMQLWDLWANQTIKRSAWTLSKQICRPFCGCSPLDWTDICSRTHTCKDPGWPWLTTRNKLPGFNREQLRIRKHMWKNMEKQEVSMSIMSPEFAVLCWWNAHVCPDSFCRVACTRLCLSAKEWAYLKTNSYTVEKCWKTHPLGTHQWTWSTCAGERPMLRTSKPGEIWRAIPYPPSTFEARHFPESSPSHSNTVTVLWLCSLCISLLSPPVSPPFSMFILPDLPGPASFSESFRNLSISRWTTASSCKLG